MTSLTVDEVLERIGGFGRYQIFLNVFANLVYGLWWATTVMIMMFIASDPGWKCANNSTCPFNETLHLGDEKYSFRCDIPREDWTFADDFTSVVTQFDLVCKRGSLGFVSTSVIFVGFFLGSLIVSTISDKFGRKIPLFACGFLCCLFNFVSAFSPAFWVFALLRALVGFTIGAYSIPLFVLATEFSGIRHRSTAGSLVWLGFVIFFMILPAAAYAIRDWRTLTMVTGAPGFLLVAGWFFTPESVRWLLKKGRKLEARKILCEVARINGKEMPDEALALPKQEKLGDFCDLFSSVKMVHKTLGSWVLWFAASFISWGISFSAPFLGGNIYLNVLISGAAALPIYPITWFLTLRFSRRKILLCSFLVAAAGAIGALLLSDKAKFDKGYMAGEIFLYLCVARLSGDMAFAMVYIYSAELFPTPLRSLGMGTSTAIARVSAFLSSYAPLLLTIHRFLPFWIMTGLAGLAAIVCMTLPETFNQPTMEDMAPEPKDDEDLKSVNSEDDNDDKSFLISGVRRKATHDTEFLI